LVDRASGKPADDYAEYYWAGDLRKEVDQFEAGFTPSPYQLFLKVIVDVFDLIVTDVDRNACIKAHHTLSCDTKYFINQKSSVHLSWAEFCNKEISMLCNQGLTWSICQFTHRKLDTGNKERTLLNAIAGILEALKQFSNPLGRAHSMSPTSPPRVSQKQILDFENEYTARRGSDTTWMELMTYHVMIISKSILPVSRTGSMAPGQGALVGHELR
jgi:hypothetical protein